MLSIGTTARAIANTVEPPIKDSQRTRQSVQKRQFPKFSYPRAIVLFRHTLLTGSHLLVSEINAIAESEVGHYFYVISCSFLDYCEPSLPVAPDTRTDNINSCPEPLGGRAHNSLESCMRAINSHRNSVPLHVISD